MIKRRLGYYRARDDAEAEDSRLRDFVYSMGKLLVHTRTPHLLSFSNGGGGGIGRAECLAKMTETMTRNNFFEGFGPNEIAG